LLPSVLSQKTPDKEITKHFKFRTLTIYSSFFKAVWAAAKRAIGTRYGEKET
jgi:hypothetical protein